jgi:UDP-N-acetylmuramoyl-L-alanyl-D-glutamate--2,6-diaminopimelate ligase
MGVVLDEDRNRTQRAADHGGIVELSQPRSPTKVLVVVTDEDPRGEDRDAINEEIASGAEAAGRARDRDLLVVADRRAAIGAAFERARAGDVVLLAGKGHERSILYADGPVPWDEAEVARAALAEIGYPGGTA